MSFSSDESDLKSEIYYFKLLFRESIKPLLKSLNRDLDKNSKESSTLSTHLTAHAQSIDNYIKFEQAKMLLNEGNLDANQRKILIELITKDLKDQLPARETKYIDNSDEIPFTAKLTTIPKH